MAWQKRLNNGLSPDHAISPPQKCLNCTRICQAANKIHVWHICIPFSTFLNKKQQRKQKMETCIADSVQLLNQRL